VATCADGERLAWAGRTATHVIRVARVAEETPAAGPAAVGGSGSADPPATAVGPAVEPRPRLEPAVPRAAVTDLAAADGHASLDSTGAEDGEPPAGGRLVGRLVHRLLARFPPGPAADEAIVLATVQALVTDEERAQVPELDAAIARAVALHRRLASRPDVQALFAEGTAAFEVPVSLVQDGRVLRGTIDCLIRRPDGALVVVEVKTGPPRPEHRRQLEAYLGAIQALGPAIRATGCLVHP
jgi:ATP-dependent exoDNAse (exonuclease V) beta subunit